MRALVVEDERGLNELIRGFLERAGFDARGATSLREADAELEKASFDVVVLDWSLPDGDGASLCAGLKAAPGPRVLMLTARTGHSDEVAAFESGADDYLRKPFDPRVLVARVRRLAGTRSSVRVAGVLVDFAAAKAFRDSRDLRLTKTEWLILERLATSPGKIVTREELLSAAWEGEQEPSGRSLDVHVRRLRVKLGEDAVRTHRGMGYSLETDDDRDR